VALPLYSFILLYSILFVIIDLSDKVEYLENSLLDLVLFPHTSFEELTEESGEKPSILNIKYKSLFKDIGFILVF